MNSHKTTISESKTITDVLTKITHHSWVFVDLDNTVMEPDHELDDLGGDQWFTHLATHYDINLILPLYREMQSHVKTKPVEKDTAKIIDALQAIGIPVIALTARDNEIRDATVRQLQHAGIDFSKNCKEKDKIISLTCSKTNKKFTYHHGIIYCNGMDKGLCLSEFINNLDKQPNEIIMIDDKEKYLHQIKTALASLNIPIHLFRYGHLDEKVKNFDITAANKQLESVQHKLINQPTVKKLNLATTATSQEQESKVSGKGFFSEPLIPKDTAIVQQDEIQLAGKFNTLTRSASMPSLKG